MNLKRKWERFLVAKWWEIIEQYSTSGLKVGFPTRISGFECPNGKMERNVIKSFLWVPAQSFLCDSVGFDESFMANLFSFARFFFYFNIIWKCESSTSTEICFIIIKQLKQICYLIDNIFKIDVRIFMINLLKLKCD